MMEITKTTGVTVKPNSRLNALLQRKLGCSVGVEANIVENQRYCKYILSNILKKIKFSYQIFSYFVNKLKTNNFSQKFLDIREHESSENS